MTRRCDPDHLPGIPAGDAVDNEGSKRAHAFGRPLCPDEVTPLWMQADLAKLETAFPAFSFAIRRSWRGFRFEAWRDSAAVGLYAVITGDSGELWRELDKAR